MACSRDTIAEIAVILLLVLTGRSLLAATPPENLAAEGQGLGQLGA